MPKSNVRYWNKKIKRNIERDKEVNKELKKAGYNLYITVLDGGKNALEVSYKKPMCLVIGSEAVGISKEIRQHGELVTLPQRRPDISYNASVAAGIFLFVMGQGEQLGSRS